MATRDQAEPAAQPRPSQRERGREAEYAARWREGAWVGQSLTTLDGKRYTLRYQGRPGTGTGPDFRDAVLLASDGERVCGDVELHLRPRNWQAHGHDRDRRYNNVALHVVIAPGSHGERATIKQDGGLAPITVLPVEDALPPHPAQWPCHDLGEGSHHHALSQLLRALGEARLHERAAALNAAMEATQPHVATQLDWSDGDITLWLALAEGLGYGRDRDAMRAEGWRLLSGSSIGRSADAAAIRVPSLPVGGTTARAAQPRGASDRLVDPTRERSGVRGWGQQPSLERSEGHTGDILPHLDTRRLEGLSHWRDRWRAAGPWREMEELLRAGSEREAARRLPGALAAGSGGAISLSRAAIVAVNVVLPFALAMAERADDTSLERRVHAVYAAMPGLPSNTITRVLTRQMGLPRPPSGAQAQQGLHHVWARWCREKRCEGCPLAASVSPSPMGEGVGG